MTKAVVVYDSKFGSTEQVALRLAVLLEDQGVTTTCVKVSNFDIKLLADVEIIAIGGPTHTFGMSKPMVEFMGRLREVSLRGKSAFAFDTRFESIISGSAAKRIETILVSLGAKIAAPRYSAFVNKQGVLKQGRTDEDLDRLVLHILESVRNLN